VKRGSFGGKQTKELCYRSRICRKKKKERKAVEKSGPISLYLFLTYVLSSALGFCPLFSLSLVYARCRYYPTSFSLPETHSFTRYSLILPCVIRSPLSLFPFYVMTIIPPEEHLSLTAPLL
jgi:hypothetical protein